ncbi:MULTISPECIES: hypothetical protein [Bradyrhizobium]|nr:MULTISPECIES: hypothetical protein [Bradyrhizobium]
MIDVTNFLAAFLALASAGVFVAHILDALRSGTCREDDRLQRSAEAADG